MHQMQLLGQRTPHVWWADVAACIVLGECRAAGRVMLRLACMLHIAVLFCSLQCGILTRGDT